MTDFTMTEIEAQHVELLPTKETLYCWNFGNTNFAQVYASNSSLALNAGSIFSTANSTALQSVSVSQG
jgi:hypothetical protein